MPIHHQKLIRRLSPDERVLEIGPGAFPYSRADVLCDRYARGEEETYRQDGNMERPVYAQPLILYSGVRTPFIDRSFDYVICSHVLEHIPAEEIHGFVAELTRIGRGGYLEFPSYALELLSDVGVHRWLINMVDGELRLLAKSSAGGLAGQIAQTLGPIFEQLGEQSPGYQKLYQDYLPVWMIGLEWKSEINYRIVDSLDELIDHRAQTNLIAGLAAIERRQAALSRRLPRAIKNRLRQLVRRRPARIEQHEQRSGLPGWLSSVTVCPACRRAGIRFDSNAVRCDECGASYAQSDMEYFLYRPALDASEREPETVLENAHRANERLH